MTKRSLGGAEHRPRTGGPGSSPGVSFDCCILPGDRTVLRRMLRDCDRKLWFYDQARAACVRSVGYVRPDFLDHLHLFDARRREIRQRLKERRDG